MTAATGGAFEGWGADGRRDFARDDCPRRQGETWTAHGDGRWSRSWGEEHHHGRVHRFGSSTCGEHWDFWEDAHTWFESRPNFGWDDALRHSPQLLAVPLRSKDGTSLLR